MAFLSRSLASIGDLYGARGAIRVLTLTFRDPSLERDYQDANFRRSLALVRVSLALGVLLFAAFAILDLWVVHRGIGAVWVIRFTMICPILLAVLAFSFTPAFKRYMQAALSTVMLATGLGVIAMTAVIDAPASYLYYAGLLDVVIYCSCIIRLRFIYTSVLSWVLFATYLVTALLINPIPLWAFGSNVFFFVTAIWVAMFAAYTQELYLRRSFLTEHLLTVEKSKSEELAAQAMAASTAKSEFLAMISHELRTPLNAILGFSEVMAQQMFGPLGQERYLVYADDIHRSGSHLLEIINNILDLTKAEAGKMEIQEEVFDAQAVLAGAIRLLEQQAVEGGVSLEKPTSEELPLLRADRRLVTQVALNLLSNAIKFTYSGGRVRIEIGLADGGELYMRFEDTGIGIAPEDLTTVQQAFTQADSRLARVHEGTGLGLPLTRNILELHGGRLELNSQPDVGTTAIAWFPACRLATERQAEPQKLAV